MSSKKKSDKILEGFVNFDMPTDTSAQEPVKYKQMTDEEFNNTYYKRITTDDKKEDSNQTMSLHAFDNSDLEIFKRVIKHTLNDEKKLIKSAETVKTLERLLNIKYG